MAIEEHVKRLKDGVGEFNKWRGGHADRVDLSDSDLRRAQLDNANLSGADLRGACLVEASLNGTNLEGADLRGADLFGARLTQVNWRGVVVSGETSLVGISFLPGYDCMKDGSHRIRMMGRDRFLNWGLIRRWLSLPLFGVSWSAFLGALVFINGLAYVNEHRFLLGVEYPIPVPTRPFLFLVGSLLLVVGSTVYRFFCPERVQTFTEAEWVEQHSHPRPLYIGDSLRRFGHLGAAQWVTALTTFVGGTIGLYMIAERLWLAGRYLWQEGM